MAIDEALGKIEVSGDHSKGVRFEMKLMRGNTLDVETVKVFRRGEGGVGVRIVFY